MAVYGDKNHFFLLPAIICKRDGTKTALLGQKKMILKTNAALFKHKMKMDMKMVAIACACVALVGVVSADLKTEFNEWKQQYNKVYSSPEEEAKRFEIYKAKDLWLQNARLEHPDYILLHNAFSDRTRDEFHHGYFNEVEVVNVTDVVDVTDVPVRAARIYRNLDQEGIMSPVKNQGGCGSCWAFAAGGLIEGVAKATGKTGSHNGFFDVSEQESVDCAYPGRDGCDGGSFHGAFAYAQNTPYVDETSYPYKGVYSGSCQTSKLTNGVIKPVAGKWQDLYAPSMWQSNKDKIIAEIDAGRPVGITVAADDLFDSWSGGSPLAGSSPGVCNNNHAVVVVGYQDSGATFIVRNSWGSWWGAVPFSGADHKGHIFIKACYSGTCCSVATLTEVQVIGAPLGCDPPCANMNKCTDGTTLVTYTCQNSQCVSSSKSCAPGICVNAACQAPINQCTTNDQCSSTNDRCSGTTRIYNKCVNQVCTMVQENCSTAGCLSGKCVVAPECTTDIDCHTKYKLCTSSTTLRDATCVNQVCKVTNLTCPSPALCQSKTCLRPVVPTYIGCYRDKAVRDITTLNTGIRTRAACNAVARTNQHAYFGLQAGRQCFTGNSYGRYGKSTFCNKTGVYEPSVIWGGSYANSVYKTSSIDSICALPCQNGGKQAGVAPECSCNCTGTGFAGSYCEKPAWTYIGCKLDDSSRALDRRQSGTFIPKTCYQAAVASGHAYFGLEYRGECWTGPTLDTARYTASTKCNMPCSLDSTQMCGGSWAIDVYRITSSFARSEEPTSVTAIADKNTAVATIIMVGTVIGGLAMVGAIVGLTLLLRWRSGVTNYNGVSV